MQGTEYYSCCYVAILSNSIRLRSHSSFSLFTLRIRQSSCRAYQEIPPSYFLKPAGGLYFPGILPCSRFRGSIYNSTEVSQVASFRPRRGRTPNNRRWNDRREWNLRKAEHHTHYRPQRGRTIENQAPYIQKILKLKEIFAGII